jgi:hypothetical protein
MSDRTMALANYRLLSYVAEEFGFDTVEEMLAATCFDVVSPAVCLRCKTTAELEPDGESVCEECGGQMRSVMLIAGLI